MSADPENSRLVTSTSEEHSVISPLPRRLPPLPSEMLYTALSPHSGADIVQQQLVSPALLSAGNSSAPESSAPESSPRSLPLPPSPPLFQLEWSPPTSRPQSPLVFAPNSDSLQVLVGPVALMATTSPTPTPTPPPQAGWLELRVCSRLFYYLS